MTHPFIIDYKQLYDKAPCGYICSTNDGEIVAVNDRFCDFTGYEKEEIIHKKTFTNFISKAQQIFYETHYQPILTVEGSIEEVNFAIIRKDKSKFPALINSVEVKDKNGTLLFIQTTVFDISQRKQYELWLLEAKEDADELTAELKTVNKTLKQTNELLKGGLSYSKKIQHSILPPIQQISEVYANALVFFNPKDEIGGDFYWYNKSDKYAYLAVVDCTGHGVPGALMSMTINSLLNEIMLKGLSYDLGDIIGLLHNKINTTLHQQKGDKYSQDGCEIGMCRLDLETKELTFSGANIDLYVHNENKLEVIHSTRSFVGGLSLIGEFDATRTFETKNVPYTKNSMLIMSTDGLFDQLNNENDNYLNAQFKNLTDQLASSDVEEAIYIMETSVTNWIQDSKQLDDMLLIAFNTDF